MPGCEALKSSATLRSTSTCSGASPVPRQQYQRMITSPGSACDSVLGSAVGAGVASDDADADGSTDAPAETDGATLAGGCPQAATRSASTDSRTANRPRSCRIRIFLRLR